MGIAHVFFLLLAAVRGNWDLNSPYKIFGVNYGNRFIPEDWMVPGPGFYEGITPLGTNPEYKTPRPCLADIPANIFRSRMLGWLDKKVVESDFVIMQKAGVNVLRLPTGYWNWIDLGSTPESPTPNGPDRQRYLNLQTVPPSDYKPYFDKIFTWAAKYGIRVLLDLHGAPGSQNGWDHSGIVLSSPNFSTPWNMKLAVSAVEAMAAYGMANSDAFFGIEVLNEPSNWGSYDIHPFLDEYYTAAIKAARKTLPWEYPMVVYSGESEFHLWPANHYQQEGFGKVLWDTHIYIFGGYQTVAKGMANYWGSMTQLAAFNAKQLGSGGALVGEWSLAGPGNAWTPSMFVKFANWLVWCWGERSMGSIFWNFDNQYATWSLNSSMVDYGVNWKGMDKPKGGYLISAAGGQASAAPKASAALGTPDSTLTTRPDLVAAAAAMMLAVVGVAAAVTYRGRKAEEEYAPLQTNSCDAPLQTAEEMIY